MVLIVCDLIFQLIVDVDDPWYTKSLEFLIGNDEISQILKSSIIVINKRFAI